MVMDPPAAAAFQVYMHLNSAWENSWDLLSCKRTNTPLLKSKGILSCAQQQGLSCWSQQQH